MADKNNKSVKISKYRGRGNINIGIFLFAVVLIYLFVTVVTYLGRDKISVYEVREGSIVRDTSYTGLVIREEITVASETDGYVSYYQNDNSKVRTGTDIYAVSPEPLDTEGVSSEDLPEASISPETQSGIILRLQNYNENYDPSDYAKVYSLKNEINTALQDTYSVTRTQQLDAVIAESGMEVASFGIHCWRIR